jgi:lathosterol oxidase
VVSGDGLGTSTFDAQHHARRETNFGFYTLLWDRLFRTLDPQYETAFASAKAVWSEVG